VYSSPIFQSIGVNHLPIYQACTPGQVYFYTPGYAARTTAEKAARFVEELRTGQTGTVGQALIDAAQTAARTYIYQMEADFRPVCLTLYLNETCNLHCTYCFADPKEIGKSQLSLEAITAAAQLVAANCSEKSLPLIIGIHGGGEPTMSFDLLQRVMKVLLRIAEEKSLPIFRYISTNGVMSVEQAHWVAAHFDRIGLSCDGPEWIQVRNRPMRTGASSLPFIERSAAIFRSAGKKYQIRVTLTPEDILNQPAIASYLCETLQPERIHIEPVYQGGRAGANFQMRPENTIPFVEAFLEARKIAADAGCDWILSGSRPREIHAGYCHPFRQVLNLVPGDTATLCFKLANRTAVESAHLEAGSYDPDSGQFRLNFDPPHSFSQIYQKPQHCDKCFLEFQCTHGCPDVCLAFGENQESPMCAIYKHLAARAILMFLDRMTESSPNELASGAPFRIDAW
jgi:uncharacterized protein